MPPLPDELHNVIADAALPLPAALRSAFTLQVLTRLRACPAESLGVGLVHRIAAEEQRNFLKRPAYPFVAQPCYDLWRRLG
jgi:hypothetical protein